MLLIIACSPYRTSTVRYKGVLCKSDTKQRPINYEKKQCEYLEKRKPAYKHYD